MGRGRGGMGRLRVIHLCQGLGAGTVGGYHIFSIFCTVNCSFMAGT